MVSGKLNPVEAYVIMESEGPWNKPNIKQVVNNANMFYVTIDTVLQTFNTWNRNKRQYLREAMIPALEAPHLVELRAKKSWLGENGHPQTNDPMKVLNIDLTKVCHKVDSYNVQGNTLYGQVTTLNDKQWGQQMTGHILQGMEVSFSLRALASITKIDGNRGIVKTQPHIVCYDRVCLPSHPEAYQDSSKPIKLKQANLNNIVQEDWTYKLSEKEAQNLITESAANFMAEESKRFKDIVKIFSICYETINISPDGKSVNIKDVETGDRFNILMEDYVYNQVSDYFSSFSKKVR